MKNFLHIRIMLIAGILFMLVNSGYPQNYFRSGMFLHHSTGSYIWGPNPDGNSSTTIPEQMDMYNASHGYTGNTAISMEENWWDEPGENNWWLIRQFVEGDTVFSNELSGEFSFDFCLAHYKMMVFKTCYPSSWIYGIGQLSDTLDPSYRTVTTYKYYWRRMINVMKNHPDHFFVLWTNAPLLAVNTLPEEAALSKAFSAWAKDTLAEGLDPEFGTFPHNVYVFDYFSKVTDQDGYLMEQYASSGEDNFHPNGAATDLVAPQFVNEIFDHAIAYENIAGIYDNYSEYPASFSPNPVSDRLTVNLPEKITGEVCIADITGRTILTTVVDGSDRAFIDVTGLSHGVHILIIKNRPEGIIRYAGKVVVN